MMRYEGAFVRRRLVRADVDPAIDGRRIARDDFAVERPGQGDPERAFSYRRRSDDGDETQGRQRSLPSL
jgi:hypothetical protein